MWRPSGRRGGSPQKGATRPAVPWIKKKIPSSSEKQSTPPAIVLGAPPPPHTAIKKARRNRGGGGYVRGQNQAAKKTRILMVTVAKTFTHEPVKREKETLAPAEVAVTQLGQISGLFTVDCTQDPVRDLTPENLKNYDIVFFYTQGPSLEIPEPNMEYFLNTWLKQKGHGFV